VRSESPTSSGPPNRWDPALTISSMGVSASRTLPVAPMMSPSATFWPKSMISSIGVTASTTSPATSLSLPKRPMSLLLISADAAHAAQHLARILRHLHEPLHGREALVGVLSIMGRHPHDVVHGADDLPLDRGVVRVAHPALVESHTGDGRSATRHDDGLGGVHRTARLAGLLIRLVEVRLALVPRLVDRVEDAA